MSATLGLCGLLLLALTQGAAADTPEARITSGARLVQDGDFDGGLIALDHAIRDLQGQAGPAAKALLARGFLYRGVAYVGLSQEDLARSSFVRCLELDPERRVDASEFPNRVRRVFEAARVQYLESVQAGKEVKRSHKTRAILLGAGGVAAGVGVALAVGPTTESRANQPPVASIVSVDPVGKALPSTTVLTFTAQGSDPDGEPISFAWSFGDGASGQGSVVQHVYLRQGEMPVELVVTDGSGGTARASASVVVGGLAGRWQGSAPSPCDVAALQLGSPGSTSGGSGVVSVTPILSGGASGKTYRGDLTHPREIFVSLTIVNSRNYLVCAEVFRGAFDQELLTLRGSYSCTEGRCSVGSREVSYIRQ